MSIQRHGTTRRYSDYDAMNAVWDAWVPEGHAPTRACVDARLANPKYRVEMAFTAAVVQV